MNRHLQDHADRNIYRFIWALLILAAALFSEMYAPTLILANQQQQGIALGFLGLVLVVVGLLLLCLAFYRSWCALKAAPRGTVRSYINIIRTPILVIVVNAFGGMVLYDGFPGPWPDIIFNAVRVIATAYAGWLVTRVGRLSVPKAALAGLLLGIIDHVIIKGGWFIFNWEWTAFGGVVISFLMYALVPMLVAALAAILGKRCAPPSNSRLETDAP